MNTTTVMGKICKPLKRKQLDDGKIVVYGELRVAHRTGYDDIPFELWHTLATKLYDHIQMNDEVVAIGKLISKTTLDTSGHVKDKKIMLVIKNVKIVK